MKKFLTIATIVLIISLSIVGVSAYLLSTDRIGTTAHVGEITIELKEDYQQPAEITPGDSYKREVWVKNTGSADCYVRIKAVFANSDTGDYCSLDLNTTDYIYDAQEEYYYYVNPISKNESTEKLFTTVTVSDTLPEDNIKDVSMVIYAESIQAGGFTDYENAWSTFSTNK